MSDNIKKRSRNYKKHNKNKKKQKNNNEDIEENMFSDSEFSDEWNPERSDSDVLNENDNSASNDDNSNIKTNNNSKTNDNSNNNDKTKDKSKNYSPLMLFSADIINKLINSKLDDSLISSIKAIYDPYTKNLNKKQKKAYDNYIRLLTNKTPTLLDIIDARKEVNETKVLKALEYYSSMIYHEPLSAHYIDYRDKINTIINNNKNLTVSEKKDYNKLTKNNIFTSEKEDFLKNILNSKYADNIKQKLLLEYDNLLSMNPFSSEYSKTKQWLKVALSIPHDIKDIKKYKKIYKNKEDHSTTKIRKINKNNNKKLKKNKKSKKINNNKLIKKNKNISFADFISQTYNKLENNIYGMKEVKKRIITDILVNINNTSMNDKILCLCGEPGVGKTAISKLLADVLDLDFIYIKLGGMSDTTKLVGHSKTYVGAQPGELVSKFITKTHKNCIIYLDEVDKIIGGKSNSKASDNKSPGLESILMKLLDPEQNNEFEDEYLGFPIDLSHVYWICSFNSKDNIDYVLKDRMDIIYVDGYNVEDKVNIAKKYLIPKICKELNFNIKHINFSDDIIKEIINKSEIKESGVRQLRRNIKNIIKEIISIKEFYDNMTNKNKKEINEIIKNIYGYKINNIKFPFNLTSKRLDRLFNEKVNKKTKQDLEFERELQRKIYT